MVGSDAASTMLTVWGRLLYDFFMRSPPRIFIIKTRARIVESFLSI